MKRYVCVNSQTEEERERERGTCSSRSRCIHLKTKSGGTYRRRDRQERKSEAKYVENCSASSTCYGKCHWLLISHFSFACLTFRHYTKTHVPTTLGELTNRSKSFFFCLSISVIIDWSISARLLPTTASTRRYTHRHNSWLPPRIIQLFISSCEWTMERYTFGVNFIPSIYCLCSAAN